MDQKKRKKRAIISICSSLAVAVIVLILCLLLIPRCSQSKVNLDIACANCVVEGANEFHNQFNRNDKVNIKITPNENCKLPIDINANEGDKHLVNGTDYTYSDITGNIEIQIKENTTIYIKAFKPLSECSWSDIKEASQSHQAYRYFNVGDEKDITINEKTCKARIIGFNQDYSDETKKEETKIGITFELTNILSDESGFSLASFWNDTNDLNAANYDYRNSTIRAVLNNEGGATINWFQYFGASHDSNTNKKFSENYANKSVLDMFPSDLKEVLVSPSKCVKVYDANSESWKEEFIKDKVFLLSPKEMGFVDSDSSASENVYSFYEDAPESKKVKYQINWHEGARVSHIATTDGAYSGTKRGYAGFNYITQNYGGFYWLRSPYINEKSYVNCISMDGKLVRAYPYEDAIGVVPCFCI